MTRLLLIISLLLSGSPAYAEWVKVGDNDEFSAYVDPDTIRRNGNLVEMWELHDFKTIQTVKGTFFLSGKIQGQYDCAEEQHRRLASTAFSGHMGTRTVVNSESDPSKWIPVIPGSVGQALSAVACSGTAYSGWVKVEGNEQLGVTVYIDPDTIRRKGNLVKMWAMYDNTVIQTASGTSYLSYKTQAEYDCVEEQLQVLAGTFFLGNMGNGTVVHSTSDTGKWQAIAPGSMGQLLWKLACGKK